MPTQTERSHSPHSPHPRRRLALCLVGLGATAAMSGCIRTPLTEDGNRSQFNRYDNSRFRSQPTYYEDEFGRKTPNLRGRLLGG